MNEPRQVLSISHTLTWEGNQASHPIQQLPASSNSIPNPRAQAVDSPKNRPWEQASPSPGHYQWSCLETQTALTDNELSLQKQIGKVWKRRPLTQMQIYQRRLLDGNLGRPWTHLFQRHTQSMPTYRAIPPEKELRHIKQLLDNTG